MKRRLSASGSRRAGRPAVGSRLSSACGCPAKPNGRPLPAAVFSPLRKEVMVGTKTSGAIPGAMTSRPNMRTTEIPAFNPPARWVVSRSAPASMAVRISAVMRGNGAPHNGRMTTRTTKGMTTWKAMRRVSCMAGRSTTWEVRSLRVPLQESTWQPRQCQRFSGGVVPNFLLTSGLWGEVWRGAMPLSRRAQRGPDLERSCP